MTDQHSINVPSDLQLAWIERNAGRVLAAGALVALNLVVIALAAHLYGLGVTGVLLSSGLAVASFLLLHRAVERMMRGALAAARREAQVSRQMMVAVEQIGAEAAGMRGTIEALCSSAQSAGLEVYIWDEASGSLWCPAWGTTVVLTSTNSRALQRALMPRSAVRIPDATAACVALPSEIALRGGATSLLVAPMWSGEEFHGLVLRRYASARELRRCDESALVASMAALGSVAIGKAVVVDREQQRSRDNELLLRSVHAASESRQRDRLSDHVQQAVEATRVERGAIFALASGRLSLVGGVGIDRLAAAGAGTIRLRSGLAGLGLDAGAASATIDLDAMDEASAIVLRRLGFAGSVRVQGLRDANGLLGMIVLAEPELGMEEDAEALLAAIGRQASLAIERTRMLRSIRKRSRHLACTPKLARSLTGQRDPEAVARIASRELHEGFGFGRVTIALTCSKDGAAGHADDLKIVASSGALAVAGAEGAAAWERSTDALRECCRTGRPYVSIVGDRDEASMSALGHGMEVADGDSPAGCRGRIIVPISGRDRNVVGAIAVYERDADLLGEDDLHMLETIADQLGGTIEQAALFATLERSYFETVEALSSALEAKDAYTLDHARSITEMSADVGRRLGMREDEIRDLKLGALLHDIGKIGVPTEILSKPGPLTEDEFEIMKEHTVIGEQIIASVEFLQGVRSLVLHEHERWDGTGYPHRLEGEAIPLGARIIFVCDSWHAMTSDRPYRKALPREVALAELRRHAGTQFDPAVVAAFCEVMDVARASGGGHRDGARAADARDVVASAS